MTGAKRRGFITVSRPQKMVDWCREGGFDHGKGGLDQMTDDKKGDVYKGKKTELKTN